MAMESSQNVPPTTSVGKSVSFIELNFYLYLAKPFSWFRPGLLAAIPHSEDEALEPTRPPVQQIGRFFRQLPDRLLLHAKGIYTIWHIL